MLERREPNGFWFLEPVGIGQPSMSGFKIDSICLVGGKGKNEGKKERRKERERKEGNRSYAKPTGFLSFFHHPPCPVAPGKYPVITFCPFSGLIVDSCVWSTEQERYQ